MRKPNHKSGSNDSFQRPVFQKSGPQLFEGLRIALTESFGFQPTFERLAKILNENVSTVHHWFTSQPHTHLVAFLALMERLSERKRHDLLHEYCRELPSLDNPRIAQDLLAVSGLEKILGKKNGLTWICGGSEFHRTFLLTALGHSFPAVAGPQAGLCGLDIHEPVKWVPLENVVYFKELVRHTRLREAIHQEWPQIRSTPADLVLLNSIWSLVPDLEGQILDMTGTHHLVVADARPPDLRRIATGIETEFHIINISPVRENERSIRLKIETP
jgi:hypothetical protein